MRLQMLVTWAGQYPQVKFIDWQRLMEQLPSGATLGNLTSDQAKSLLDLPEFDEQHAVIPANTEQGDC